MEKQSVKAKQNSDRLVCRLGRDSGVVMLEFALMMPLLLTLIAGVVEVPHMLLYRPRALNAARVIADIRSRNDDAMPSDANLKKVQEKLFGDLSGNPSVTPVNVAKMNPTVIKKFSSFVDFCAVRIITGVLTFGESGRLLSTPLGLDYFSGGQVKVETRTLLPKEFLCYAIDWKGDEKMHFQSRVCGMPNRNGYVKSHTTLWEQLKGIFK